MSAAVKPAPVRLEGIESLRAYAAVAIVLFHVVWVGHAEPPKVIDFVKWNGGFGVQLFFAVSAFSLAYGYWGRLASEAQLRGYFLRRFARIAPLYYAVFAFQLVNIYVQWGSLPSLADMGLCAAFVFNFVPRLVDGIVPASWSIGVEMVFYVLFPFVLLLCRTWWASLLVLGAALLVAFRFAADLAQASQLAAFASHSIVAQLPFFCWGVVGYHAYVALRDTTLARGHARGLSWTIVAAALVLLAVLVRSSDLYMAFWNRGLRTVWDALWGVPFALLCIGLAVHPTRFVSNAVTRYLGKVSYSLYLLHPAVVAYAGKVGAYRAIYESLPGNELLAFGICALFSVIVVAGLSALTFRYIEAPGMRWGKRVVERRAMEAGQGVRIA